MFRLQNGISVANGLVSCFVRIKSKETKHEKKKSWREPKKSHSIRVA